MKRRARRAPISGRSAPSIRARRAHPGTHPPPSIRPRPLQIPSSRPSVGTQSPEQVGHFRSPEVGHFRRPFARSALLGRVSRFRAMPVGGPGDTGRTGRRSSVVGAGFALPRDAGCRSMPVGGPHRENWPALQALLGRVSRSRAIRRRGAPAMPVGGPHRTGQRSKPRRPCAGIPRRTQKKPARWRVSRGAAVAAPRGVPADFGRGQVIVR